MPELKTASSVQESLLDSYLAELLEGLADVKGGEVATYIPELAKAHPGWLGVAIATVDGAVYVAGDADIPFTIQSVSKPFLYGLALETLGREEVLKHVGVEPTGNPFNSTVLDEINNRPFNPMVNAGAIAVTALVQGDTYAEKTATMLQMLERYVGHPVEIDEQTFRSEKETGDRNRAIAALMHESHMIEGGMNDVLDLYFSGCSVLVTCRDLAIMSATLANGGVNPVTGQRAITTEYVHDVITVMNSCGMYNYAGQWSYEVGIPAKSGVSGSIAAVIPGQMGIAAFSPPLDRFGNSVRAIAACKRIAEDFGLHVFRTPPSTASAIRRELSGDSVRSKRGRSPRQAEILVRSGARIRVIEAQGPLFFGSAERLARRIMGIGQEADYIIVDMRRVFTADPAARSLIKRLVRRMADEAAHLIFAHMPDDYLEDILPADVEGQLVFADRDSALEWCEDDLLSAQGVGPETDRIALEEIELFSGLSPSDLQELQTIARQTEFAPGQAILAERDEAHHLSVILSGAASVRLRLAGRSMERSVRLATVGAGATIGEMGIFGAHKRSADVIADRQTQCLAFYIDDLNRLARERPAIMHTIMSNVNRNLAERLRTANTEIRSLEV